MKKHIGLAGVSVALALMVMPAQAQAPQQLPEPGAPISAEGRALGQCQIAHSKPEHEAMMRTMMIDALKDDTESLNRSALAISMAIITVATESCALKLTDLKKEAFGEGMGVYGEFLGQKIMSAAMAKMNL
jgi:hypothetical protein